MCKIEEPDEAATHLWYNRENVYARTVAFLIFVNLFVSNQQIEAAHFNLFWIEAVRTLTSASFGATWFEKQAALNALKWYGRLSEENAHRVLIEFARMEDSDIPEQREFYNDLKFEFEINALTLPFVWDRDLKDGFKKEIHRNARTIHSLSRREKTT